MSSEFTRGSSCRLFSGMRRICPQLVVEAEWWAKFRHWKAWCGFVVTTIEFVSHTRLKVWQQVLSVGKTPVEPVTEV